jgi:hypothetical protein
MLPLSNPQEPPPPAPEPQKKIKLSHKQMERESDKKTQRDWMTEHEPFSNVCVRSPNHGSHQTAPEKKKIVRI